MYVPIKRIWQKLSAVVTLSAFIITCVTWSIPLAGAQDSLSLPPAGSRIFLSPGFTPPLLKGIKVYPNDPLRLDFILNTGDGSDHDTNRLIKYFLTALTTPEKDMWVNLSPYEQDRIVPDDFGKTEMGRDLLAQDYVLKQLTASLMYPEENIGKKFWERVYTLAAEKFGTTDIPVNTFNKVWIMPESAIVYENSQAGSAYIIESRLKVMLEQDYLAMSKDKDIASQREGNASSTEASRDVNELGSRMVREIIIPELTKEVNEGTTFIQLRQAYNALILATWYKKKVKRSLLRHVYVDRNRISGIDIDDPKEKQTIYQQYLEAFKVGAYNYIKDETDPFTHDIIPRKYFSGGIVAKFSDMSMTIVSDASQIMLANRSEKDKLVAIMLDRAQAVKKISREMVIRAMLSFQKGISGITHDNQTKKDLRDAVVLSVSQETGREAQDVEAFLKRAGLFSGKALLSERKFQTDLTLLNKADIEVIAEEESLGVPDDQFLDKVVAQILSLLDVTEGTIYQQSDVRNFVLSEFPLATDHIVTVRRLVEFNQEKIMALILSLRGTDPEKLHDSLLTEIMTQTGASLKRVTKHLNEMGFTPVSIAAEKNFLHFDLKQARQFIKEEEENISPEDFFLYLVYRIAERYPVINSEKRILQKLDALGLGNAGLVQKERDLLAIDIRFIRDFMRSIQKKEWQASQVLDALVGEIIALTEVPEERARAYIKEIFGIDRDDVDNKINLQRQYAAIETVLANLTPLEITDIIRASLDDSIDDKGILSYVINSVISNRKGLAKFSNQGYVIEIVREKLKAMGYGNNSDLIHIRRGEDAGVMFVPTDDGIRRVTQEDRYKELVEVLNMQLLKLGQGYPDRAITSTAELKNIVNSIHFKLAGKNKTTDLIARQATEADPSTGKGSEGQHERELNERSRKLSLFVYYLIAKDAGNAGMMDLFLGLYPDKKAEFEKYRVLSSNVQDGLSVEVRSYLADLIKFFGITELKRLKFPFNRITSSDVHARKQQIQPTETELVTIYKKLNYGKTTDGRKIRDILVTPDQWDTFQKTSDAAMNVNEDTLRGGIDFDTGKLNMELRNNGDEINLNFDQALIERFRAAPGFVPVSINIQPMADIRIFLGLKGPSSAETH